MRLSSLNIPIALVLALSAGCGGGKTDTATESSSGVTTTDATMGTTIAGTTTGTTTAGTTTAGTTTDPTSSTTGTPTTSVGTITTVGTTTDGENCPAGYSAGCCFGDGVCCPCVGFDCEPLADAAAIEEFQVCACQQDVCADACAIACEGGGIDLSCFLCADKAAQTTCVPQFMACGGTLDATCDPPVGCEACQYCALTGQCYDSWFACWSDVGGCQDLIIACEPMCGEDPACLQTCADGFPNGPGLYQPHLDCMYCTTCAADCDNTGVTCDP